MFLKKEAVSKKRIIVEVNQVGAVDNLSYDGMSCVVDENGDVFARARGFEEQLLIVNPLCKIGKLYEKNPTQPQVEFSLDYEKDLEQALITHLQKFLLELGNGFTFVARQKRILIEDDEFFADLVFYNRLLRCFVVIELKTEKLTHQDLGQLQMYVNYYDCVEKTEDENPTIGILLCTAKNDTVVKMSLPEDNSSILASKYQLYLPTQDQLKTEVESLLRIASDDKIGQAQIKEY